MKSIFTIIRIFFEIFIPVLSVTKLLRVIFSPKFQPVCILDFNFLIMIIKDCYAIHFHFFSILNIIILYNNKTELNDNKPKNSTKEDLLKIYSNSRLLKFYKNLDQESLKCISYFQTFMKYQYTKKFQEKIFFNHNI